MSEPTREQLRLCVHELGHAAVALALGYDVTGFSVRATGTLGSGWVLVRHPTPCDVEQARRSMVIDVGGAVAEFLGDYTSKIDVAGHDKAAVDEQVERWWGRTAPPQVHASELTAAIDTARRLLLRGCTMIKIERLARKLAEFQTEFDETFTLAAGLYAASEPAEPAKPEPPAAGADLLPIAQAAAPVPE